MKKLKNFSLLVLSMLALNIANAQTVNSFTAQQAVDYAKKNSVLVKNALLDILIQKQTWSNSWYALPESIPARSKKR